MQTSVQRPLWLVLLSHALLLIFLSASNQKIPDLGVECFFIFYFLEDANEEDSVDFFMILLFKRIAVLRLQVSSADHL